MKFGRGSSGTKAAQERKRNTSYDVAKLAGVSQSTVTRVFKDGASASPKMRKLVIAAANELGYRPNAIARGLTTNRSNLVAVVISEQTTLNYPEVLVHLTEQLSERKLRALLLTSDSDTHADKAMELMLEYRVDGAIIATPFSDNHLRTIKVADIPIIYFNRASHIRPVSSVQCDQEEGERLLASALLSAGHSSFGIIEGLLYSTVSIERKTGILGTLENAGIGDITSVAGDYSYEAGRRGFVELVQKRGAPPDAVIAINDMMAIGCIDEARYNHGLKVPEDISIVGFDGVGPARHQAYSLTTIQQPVKRMAEAAISMLVERIENPDASLEKRKFSGELIPGGSARLGDVEI